MSKLLKRVWYFIWKEDSVWSWAVNIVLAFVIIKFILYPGLGWVLGTPTPVVAVVSSSMEHDAASFDEWWNDNLCCNEVCDKKRAQHEYYDSLNITKEQFSDFSFVHGFDKGDIMVLFSAKDVEVGDVLVYRVAHRSDPIIHRVVNVKEINGKRIFMTKGDHNCGIADFELEIPEENVLGKAVLRVPLLGWIKIIFVKLLQIFGLWR